MSLPACITRDNLTSPYWPNTNRAALASVVVLGVVFLFTSFNRLNHTDLWAHVNFGEWIVAHRALPVTDPLAATPADIAVPHTAWLAQVLAYETYAQLGNEGLALGHALLVALTAGVLMLAIHRRGVVGAMAATAGLAFLLLDLPIVGTIRPQLFGQLGLALFLLAAAELPHKKQPLLWLPVVAALWANLHGSLPIGLAVLLIHAVAATISRSSSAPRAWLAVVLAAIAGCLNPHGPALYAHILGFGQHEALATITEWRRLPLVSLTGGLFVLSLAALAVAAWFSPRRWPLADILVLSLFGLALLTAIRMQAWWALIVPYVLWPQMRAVHAHWTNNSSAANSADRANLQDTPTAMRTLIVLSFLFTILVVAPPSFSFIAGRARGEALILSTDTPIYVAAEAVRRGLAGTIAAPLDWSDYLTRKSDGQLKPLVHTHVHLADAEAWRAYETIFRGDAGWLEALQAQQIRYLLVPRGRSPQLAKHVLTEDRSGKNTLRVIYQDQRCLLAEIAPTPQESTPQ